MSSELNDVVELELQADAVAIRSIMESGIIRQFKAAEACNCRLIATYYDTPYHTLRKAGISLCVRQEKNHFDQMVRQSVAGLAGLRTFRMCNGPVADARPDASAVDDKALRLILKRGGRDKRLIPIFTIDAERTTMPLVVDGNQIELVLNRGRIIAPAGQSEDISQIELAQKTGNARSILDLALKLNEIETLNLGYLSNADRGYALAHPRLQPQDVRAGKPPLDATMTVSEAFYTIMDDAVGHLRANEIPVAMGYPEGVHQARVAIRRIRASLMSFGTVLPRKKCKKFNREFRWFQGQLSPARDWYVLLHETIPMIRAAWPGKKAALSRFQMLASHQLERSTMDVGDLFHGRRYTRLILELSRWLARKHAAIDARAGGLSLPRFAANQLDVTHAKLMVDTRPLSRMTAEDRHTLRKRGKKARYACEFFSGLWPGRQTLGYLRSMRRLQESLGQINDLNVAGQLHLLLGPDKLDDELRFLLRDWSADAIRQCNRAAQPAWRQFQHREPFWRGNL